MTPPTSDASISFERDIKPLFRADDRSSMRFAFDLWDASDVRANAESILERLRDGTMPCDIDWPPDWIDRFRLWIATGAND